ncbi:hypothetical protein B0H19DRAFT_964911 [Mycena capillaripes]|nr:hypothetical protein B0H19DRAFT_964911 [Mycena capillaripes]
MQGGQEDYADKGLDALERKEGLPDNRATNEKITDGARNMFENATGCVNVLFLFFSFLPLSFHHFSHNSSFILVLLPSVSLGPVN